MPLPLLPTVTDTPSPEEITPYPCGVKGYGVIASGEGVRARGTATATNRRFTLRGDLIFDFRRRKEYATRRNSKRLIFDSSPVTFGESEQIRLIFDFQRFAQVNRRFKAHRSKLEVSYPSVRLHPLPLWGDRLLTPSGYAKAPVPLLPLYTKGVIASGEGVILSSISVPLRLLIPKGYATHVPRTPYPFGVKGYRGIGVQVHCLHQS